MPTSEQSPPIVAPPVARPGIGLIVALVVMTAFGGYMFWAQNIAEHQGGHISIQKVFWLSYAITAFFLMPFFFWLDKRVAPVLHRIYAVHLVLWAVRGVAELYLMYGVHLWIPPYGVAHNVIAITTMTALVYRWRDEVAAIADVHGQNARRYLRILRGALVCEITFAVMFYETVGRDTRTTWFANTQPKFDLINQLTLAADIVLIPLLLWTVYIYYRRD